MLAAQPCSRFSNDMRAHARLIDTANPPLCFEPVLLMALPRFIFDAAHAAGAARKFLPREQFIVLPEAVPRVVFEGIFSEPPSPPARMNTPRYAPSIRPP